MLLDQLKALHPTQFEHLIFDLMVLSGLRNATWRTPGADGGRDIEGVYVSADFAGDLNHERWYVECKRYDSSLDWPSVYAKIAYAENHKADFLLICTTASLSPRCKEELQIRARQQPRLRVRHWDGASLESRIEREPLLLAKFNLGPAPSHPAALAPLMTLAQKSTQTAYAISVSEDHCSPALECAAALVELIETRSRDGHDIHIPFQIDRDCYEWVACDEHMDLSLFEAAGLRALLAAARFYMRLSSLRMASASAAGHPTNRLALTFTASPLSEGYIHNLPLIAVSANVEVAIESTAIYVQHRTS